MLLTLNSPSIHMEGRVVKILCLTSNLSCFPEDKYGKCPKILNTLNFEHLIFLPKIISENVLKSQTVAVLQKEDF